MPQGRHLRACPSSLFNIRLARWTSEVAAGSPMASKRVPRAVEFAGLANETGVTPAQVGPLPACRPRQSRAQVVAGGSEQAFRLDARHAAEHQRCRLDQPAGVFERRRRLFFAAAGDVAERPYGAGTELPVVSMEMRFSAAFWAVPAPIRVEPTITSGPESRRTGMSVASSSGAPALLAMPMVSAVAALAAAAAATV